MTRYLVTEELKTPWYLIVLRWFKLRPSRREFFIEVHRFWTDDYWDGQIIWWGRKEAKVITKCKQRLVWKQ